jgi:hypothetical protein
MQDTTDKTLTRDIPNLASPVEGLQSVQAAFCDSLEVLSVAYDQGLPRDTPILTSSPAVLLSGARYIESLEARVPQETFQWAHSKINDFCRTIEIAVRASPDIEPYALVAAQKGIFITPIMLRAASLTEHDYTESRAVLLAEENKSSDQSVFEGPWAELLSSSEKMIILRAPINPTKERSRRGESVTPLLKRLKLAGPERFAYRAFLFFWKMLPRSLSRGEILIIKENELVKETALQLGLRGYGLRRFEGQPNRSNLLAEDIRKTFRRTLSSILREHFQNILIPNAVEHVVEIYFDQIFLEIGQQQEWEQIWEREFSVKSSPHPVAILTNFPNPECFVPLRKYARNAQCLIAGFQHGVSREIGWAMEQFEIIYENIFSDLLIVYNERAKRVALRNQFATECRQIEAVGMPKDYFRICGPRANKQAPPILFVSTLLYRGYVQLRFEEKSDIEKAQDEINLIENVLDCLPHKVAYKPYPAMRFPDPDPVMATVLKAKSVEISGTHIDLRYILGRHRILISSRSTSTIAWCVMSGRPFIFIDTGDYFTIQEDVRQPFIDGTFFFDGSQPGWENALREFLLQPIEEIERQWRDKEPGRQALVENCFSAATAGAGHHVANVITDWLNPKSL